MVWGWELKLESESETVTCGFKYGQKVGTKVQGGDKCQNLQSSPAITFVFKLQNRSDQCHFLCSQDLRKSAANVIYMSNSFLAIFFYFLLLDSSSRFCLLCNSTFLIINKCVSVKKKMYICLVQVIFLHLSCFLIKIIHIYT